MSFWDTKEGYETGEAIRELANATKRSKATKYEAPMQVKTFVFKYFFVLSYTKYVIDFFVLIFVN